MCVGGDKGGRAVWYEREFKLSTHGYYVVTTVKTRYSVRERQKGRTAKGQGQGQVGKPTQIDLLLIMNNRPLCLLCVSVFVFYPSMLEECVRREEG